MPNGKAWFGDFVAKWGMPGLNSLGVVVLAAVLLMIVRWGLPYLDSRVSQVDNRTKANYSASQDIKEGMSYLEQSITGQIDTESGQRKQEHDDILNAVRVGFGRLDRTLTQIDISLREQNRLFLVLCHNGATNAAAHRRCDGEQ